MQDDLVQNAKHLVITIFMALCRPEFLTWTMRVYAMVNIEDSKAMKRLSYITKYDISSRIIYGSADCFPEGREMTAHRTYQFDIE